MVGLDPLVQLANSFFERDLGPEPQAGMDLVEGDAVVPLVTIVDVGDLNMRHNARYLFGNLSQAVIQVVVSDIEDLTCHDRRFGFKAKHKCARSIVDMQERPPLLTIEDGNLTGSRRSGGQQVDHQVKPWAGGESEQGSETKNSGVKVARRNLEQQFLRIHLCLRIGRDRGSRRKLVHQKLGGTVYAAT